MSCTSPCHLRTGAFAICGTRPALYSRVASSIRLKEKKMRTPLALFLLILPLTVLSCAQQDAITATNQSVLAVGGDGACTRSLEDCGTCPGDCPCPGGFVCSNRQCVPVCGDGSCAPGA